MKAILVVLYLGTALAIWWSLLDARKLKTRHERILDELERQIEITDYQLADAHEINVAMRARYAQKPAP